MSSRRRRAVRRAHANLYGHGYGVGGGMAVRYSYQPDRHDRRHDRRRERRMRRRYGHHGHRGHPGLLLVIGVLIGLAILVRLAVSAVEVLWPVLVVLAVGGALFALVRRHTRRRESQEQEQVTPQPVSGEQAWRHARDGFAALRQEYSAHECDPMAVLRRPALSDVSVASTARFVDAFAEAQALDTDTYPGQPHDDRYVAAVERARRAWTAAQDAADRIRLSGLAPEERASVERVLKLLTTARDSDSEPERLAAYARARSELDRLDRAGVVHLPRTARAALDEASRGVLPG